MAVLKLCDYGCGKDATHQFKNGKWCCEKNREACPQMKEKRRQSCLEKYGVEHPSQNKEVQNKMRQTFMEKYGVDHNFKINAVQEKKKQTFMEKYGVDHNFKIKAVQEKKKQTYIKRYGATHYTQSLEAKEKLLEKHPFFRQVEEIRIEDNQFKVHCKNRNCENSKEKGGWFTPARLQLHNRITALETEGGSDGSFFYCSQYCKTTCDAFNVRGDPERDNQLPYTQEQLQTFRLEVLTRDNYICQYCGKLATVVHHEKPVKLYPESALDPDYGWSCCEKCHYAKGHPKETSCSTGALAAVVCKSRIKREHNGSSNSSPVV